MKQFHWNLEKNELLQAERNISFEDVVEAISSGGLLAITKHHNPEKYPNQRLFVVEIRGYAYTVPFVESETAIFLKTVIPSRKATKQFLTSSQNNESEQSQS